MTAVTREITFDAAHMLDGYDGLCRNLHGHTYHLFVTASGAPDASGMVVDFKRLKELMKELISDHFDHAFMYDSNSETEKALAEFLERRSLRTVALPFRTTAENLARHFFTLLSPVVPVSSVKVYETPNSCAEYRA